MKALTIHDLDIGEGVNNMGITVRALENILLQMAQNSKTTKGMWIKSQLDTWQDIYEQTRFNTSFVRFADKQR